MAKNTIHTESEARKILNGDYFGQDGALAIARCDYQEGKKNAQVSMKLMSTIFSALGHALARARVGLKCRDVRSVAVYGYYGLRLLFELDDVVYDVATSREKKESLTPGERDVFIAGLLAAAKLGMLYLSFWYEEEAITQIKKQLKLPPDHVSNVFAKARAVHLGRGFSYGQLEEWRDVVHFVVHKMDPDNPSCPYSWMDIARLARLVGDSERQQFAARRSGEVDVKMKAGV